MKSISTQDLPYRNQAKSAKGGKNQAGFTLIELLVVTGLSVMLLLTISSMFMTFLVSNSTTNMRKIINAEGNHALNQISFIIRNATSINSPCTGATTNSFSVDSIDGGTTVFQATDDNGISRIASNSSLLTSSDVTLGGDAKAGDQIAFSCTQTGGTRYVVVSFGLQHPEVETISDNFSAQILVRN